MEEAFTEHSILFMYLCVLRDDGRMERSKHSVESK